MAGPKGTTSAAPAHTGHAVENAEVARIFREVADLLEVQSANPFRVRAYHNAARVVEESPEPVDCVVRTDPRRLTDMPGVGEDLAGKIAEIVRTGTLAILHDLQHEAPPGAADLMRLPGLGPKRAKALCNALHVRSLAGLERAARAGRVHTLKGFGEKAEQKILKELHGAASEGSRMPLAVASQYGESLLSYVRSLPGVTHAEIAGSYRRRKETVGDLDLLVVCAAGSAIADRFVKYSEAKEVLAHGPTKAAVRLHCGLQVDLRVVPERSQGSALHYLTGSKTHNIAIRRLGQEGGLKINEYGVFDGSRQVGGATEEDVYRAVGLPWIPPELREDRGEIDAARDGRLPQLLALTDIRGDLQCHTTDSDGRDSLEAMAEAAEALGYEYLAITDHSPALRMVRGLDADGFRRQMRRIDRLNARLRKLTLLKGAEVDILPDGSLDLPDAVLESLDVVVAAVHSKLDLPPEHQTQRVMKALGHRSVDILAHPTGRIIGRRRAMSLNLDQIMRVACDNGVLLELNAQPERLDLDDTAARAATAAGVKLVIDTDAHAAQELRFMRWGVDQARRAWAEKRHVANSLPLPDLMKLLHVCRR